MREVTLNNNEYLEQIFNAMSYIFIYCIDWKSIFKYSMKLKFLRDSRSTALLFSYSEKLKYLWNHALLCIVRN